ncbi:MAG: phosphoribosylanthranilate isomerase [Acidobacteria bacterium]|nr:phosphoribosylanthranilate isomerase [Acidobacteriota bacterium]
MTRVKICGLRRAEDVAVAVAAGADALGFNFWKASPRYVSPQDAARLVPNVPPSVLTVGVFVDEEPERVLAIAEETGIMALQLHGSESPEYLDQLGAYLKIKTIKVGEGFQPQELSRYASASLFLVEGLVAGMVGGTGRTFDWSLAEKAKEYGKIILAGGLTPENVAEAVRRVRPWGVDVASGVESEPGRKDPRLIREFIRAARSAEQITVSSSTA